MHENEVKILEIDRKVIEEKLIELGAEKIFHGNLNVIYFDTSEGTLNDSDCVLRLRTEGDKVFLTHKKALSRDGIKLDEEIQVEVSDFEKTKTILLNLGYIERKKIQKIRTSYALENVHFDIDKYLEEHSYIPEFMEIEAVDINDIYKYAELLGFSKEDCKPWTGGDLVKYYKKKI